MSAKARGRWWSQWGRGTYSKGVLPSSCGMVPVEDMRAIAGEILGRGGGVVEMSWWKVNGEWGAVKD